ncbi:MAG TPA: HAD family hydrolase [Ignavibacteria bacterium]|nr:HAD family hydrolase [Ignavibacteria bacterium]HMR41204.1 HAD family hydrolase [Ignavibacteria bacterium]
MQNNILPSWNETPIKKTIIEFLGKITKENSPEFIPVKDRIAVFDNDGTLWTEQPLQVQVLYCLDRMRVLGDKDPGLVETQPLKGFYERDLKMISSMTKEDLFTFLLTTLDGNTPEDYRNLVLEWFKNAVHPKFKFSYYNTAFKPQIELLRYLEANGFKNFIVSGGGIDFMRTIGERIYELPEYQIIGSSIKTKVEYDGTIPIVKRDQLLNSFDDREEKINNINLHIGKKPVLAFGNSDGDLAMIRYTLSNGGLGFILHHDDDVREVAYDRNFRLSPLNEGLDVAEKEGINIVSMKNDWKEIFSVNS